MSNNSTHSGSSVGASGRRVAFWDGHLITRYSMLATLEVPRSVPMGAWVPVLISPSHWNFCIGTLWAEVCTGAESPLFCCCTEIFRHPLHCRSNQTSRRAHHTTPLSPSS